jgi:hypothetical protein
LALHAPQHLNIPFLFFSNWPSQAFLSCKWRVKMLSRSTHSLSRTCQFLEVSSSRGKRAFCRAIAGCYV